MVLFYCNTKTINSQQQMKFHVKCEVHKRRLCSSDVKRNFSWALSFPGKFSFGLLTDVDLEINKMSYTYLQLIQDFAFPTFMLICMFFWYIYSCIPKHLYSLHKVSREKIQVFFFFVLFRKLSKTVSADQWNHVGSNKNISVKQNLS